MAEKTKKDLIMKDLDKYADLDLLANSKGGKVLIEYLQDSFVTALEELLTKYKTETNLIPLIAIIDEKLNLMRALSRAETNKELVLKALKEEENRGREL